ncbi:olfactory receptor 56B2-like [Pelodytes ibericus]
MANNSGIFQVELVGFPGLAAKYHLVASLAMFLVYNVSLLANGTVILLVLFQQCLHQPMYKIIGNLALSDLLFDTITLPKIIGKYWYGAGFLSLHSCIIQSFCVHCLGSLDSYIITLMAFDRYVAICQPLRYSSVVTNKLTSLLCALVWFLAGFTASYSSITISQLKFCSNNQIKNCFCSTLPIYSLACQDISAPLQTSVTIAMFVLLVPLTFILLSYIIIITTIYSSTRSENWQKAFYTCTTHLLVIGLYYVPRVLIYLCNLFHVVINADINVLILCLYTYFPHVASPIIYCLRTEKLKSLFDRRKINFQIKDKDSLATG